MATRMRHAKPPGTAAAGREIHPSFFTGSPPVLCVSFGQEQLQSVGNLEVV